MPAKGDPYDLVASAHAHTLPSFSFLRKKKKSKSKSSSTSLNTTFSSSSVTTRGTTGTSRTTGTTRTAPAQRREDQFVPPIPPSSLPESSHSRSSSNSYQYHHHYYNQHHLTTPSSHAPAPVTASSSHQRFSSVARPTSQINPVIPGSQSKVPEADPRYFHGEYHDHEPEPELVHDSDANSLNKTLTSIETNSSSQSSIWEYLAPRDSQGRVVIPYPGYDDSRGDPTIEYEQFVSRNPPPKNLQPSKIYPNPYPAVPGYPGYGCDIVRQRGLGVYDNIEDEDLLDDDDEDVNTDASYKRISGRDDDIDAAISVRSR